MIGQIHGKQGEIGGRTQALFNPETSIFIQKCHPYTGNLNSETSGDSKTAFLHCGDVLGEERGLT